MRNARIKADGAGYYHCISRIIERRRILGDREKARLLTLMRSLAAFGGLEILTYAFMANHFHILLYVPERRDVPDEEFLQRLRHVLVPFQVDQIAQQLSDLRQRGESGTAEALKARFTYRMYSLSEFFKAFKQRFSQHYNVRTGRCGPLWEQRFKSLLVEPPAHGSGASRGSAQALLAVAAYIDLNAVRAGLAADPKDYRYSGYGAAMGGEPQARRGLRRLMQHAAGGGRVSWGRAQRAYRQQLYVRGEQKGLDPEGRPIRQGFSPEQVEAVLKVGGRLPLHEALRCRVRYFTDGLALGSESFMEGVFQRYRERFGPTRQSGARPMRFAQWGGLCTLRDLRLQPVTRSSA